MYTTAAWCLTLALTLSLSEWMTGPQAPAGTGHRQLVRLNDRLYLDRYEVSNADYGAFLAHLKAAGQDDLYARYRPDTALWRALGGGAALANNYHAHPAYHRHPVLGITYEAAVAYCRWQTAQYMSAAGKKFKKVIFRLPTEAEWTEAACEGKKMRMYPWAHYYLRNAKGEYLCNFLRLGDQSISYDAVTKTYKVLDEGGRALARPEPVHAYLPTGGGFHNLSGNAAEMVAEQGLAKGGSFNDPGHDVQTGSRKWYTGPSA